MLNDKDNISEFKDLDDAYEVIVMKAEDGTEKEYVVVDGVENEGSKYLLVIESEFIDDEEAEAVILKEIEQEGDDSIYEIVEQDSELEKLAELFQNSNEDYDIEL